MVIKKYRILVSIILAIACAIGAYCFYFNSQYDHLKNVLERGDPKAIRREITYAYLPEIVSETHWEAELTSKKELWDRAIYQSLQNDPYYISPRLLLSGLALASAGLLSYAILSLERKNKVVVSKY